MKVPKKLKIGAHWFTVELVKDKEKLNARHECGTTSFTKNLIQIDGKQKQSQIEETFFHELLHTLNNTMAHETIHALAQQLHQVLSDNKMLK